MNARRARVVYREKTEKLAVAASGDDSPYLFIQRFGEDEKKGVIVAPELYHGAIRDEAGESV